MKEHDNRDIVKHAHAEFLASPKWDERFAALLVNSIGTLQFAALACIVVVLWFTFGPRIGIDNPQRTVINLILSTMAAIFQSLTILAVRTTSKLAQLKADADYKTDLHSAETSDEILRRVKRIEEKIVGTDGWSEK